jgi:hypothetical protein
LPFWLGLPLFVSFVGLAAFLLLDAFLSFSLASDLLVVLHGVSDSRFKLCAFVVNRLIKGEIEKPSDQFIGLIMMSH